MKKLNAAILLTINGFIAVPTFAQGELWSVEGTTANEFVGEIVSSIGDINLDGFGDIAIGMPNQNQDRGEVRLLSGADGSVLYANAWPAVADQFGASLARCEDLNGDGYPEVLVGVPLEFSSDGGIRVLNGIHTVDPFQPAVIGEAFFRANNEHFGQAVAGVGDLNGDGVSEVAVGAPFSARVYVYSGTDLIAGSNTPLYTVFGQSGSGFGATLSRFEDVDGDLVPDFLVGAPMDGCNLGAGAVFIVSGMTGSLVPIGGADRLCGVSAAGQLGFSLSAGDVDADGHLDLVAGAPFAPNGGRVEIVSMQGPSFLARLDGGAASEQFGASVSATGDYSGDGFADVLVGAPNAAGSGAVRVFSGAAISNAALPIEEYLGVDFGVDLGGQGSVALAPMLNGDNLADPVLGAPNHDSSTNTRAGIVTAIRGGQPQIGSFLCNGDGGDQLGCTSCPCSNDAVQGTVGGCLNSAMTSARLEATGDTSVSLPPGANTDLRFAMTGLPPSVFAVLNSGDAIGPRNIASPCFGLNTGSQAEVFDGLRCAIVNTRRHGGRAADSSGQIGTSNSPWGGESGPAVGIALSGTGFVAGQTRYFQTIYRDDPSLSCMRGLNTSQAVEIMFTP